ncbi:ATP-binding cassette domain-containing protein [Mycoplasmopsis cynos]|nr:ATP-binding cassette domain-containing protein [Mycoplasmopsis cynos]
MNKLTEKEARKLLVRDILISVGLDESVLRRYPLEFSGGQQQRIGISRAVVLRPQLLIADEPNFRIRCFYSNFKLLIFLMN